MFVYVLFVNYIYYEKLIVESNIGLASYFSLETPDWLLVSTNTHKKFSEIKNSVGWMVPEEWGRSVYAIRVLTILWLKTCFSLLQVEFA